MEKIVARRFNISSRFVKLKPNQWRLSGDERLKETSLSLKIKDDKIYADIIKKIPKEDKEKISDNYKDDVLVECLIFTVKDGCIVEVKQHKEKVANFSYWS